MTELLIIGGEIIFAGAIFTLVASAPVSVPTFLAATWIGIALGFAVNSGI